MTEKEVQDLMSNLGEKVVISLATLAGTTLATALAGVVFPPAAPLVGALAGPVFALATEKIIDNIKEERAAHKIPEHVKINVSEEDEPLSKSKIITKSPEKENHEHKDLGTHTHKIIEHEHSAHSQQNIH